MNILLGVDIADYNVIIVMQRTKVFTDVFTDKGRQHQCWVMCH